jgi:hypothetical protein
MNRPEVGTNEVEELAKGRVALWIDQADLEYIARHCFCADDASQDQVERCARIRFRANAALHKAGLKSGVPI